MKEFKKSDLKSGQVVVTRNGNKYIVVGDLLIRNKGYNSISGGYKEDLTSLYYDGFDIMKVYERNWDRGLESIDDLRTATLVWKREEPIVLNEKEKAVLVLYDDFKWIARDSDNELVVYIAKPEKRISYWKATDDEDEGYYIPSHLFQFVKWEDEEPTSLDELRKGIKNEKN